MNRLGLFASSLVLGLMLLGSTLLIVDQRQVAVIFALGEIKQVITEPGLNWKLPPPFQNVVFLDKRVQTLDSPETRPIFTAEKKSLVIDWLVKWRISEPRQFIRNNGTDLRNLENRLSPVVQAAFNEEVTKRNVQGVLSRERDRVTNDVRARLADEASAFGIEIVDVRIQRTDLTQQVSSQTFERMKAERLAEAALLRAFALAPGVTFSREDLVDGSAVNGGIRTVDVQITRLRRKIEPDSKFPRFLQTVRGKGYVLRLES